MASGWPRDLYTGPGGGLYTGPGGGLYTGPGGGLYTGPGGGLYTGEGGGLFTGPCSDPYHANRPPLEYLRPYLLQMGLGHIVDLLDQAGAR